MNSDILQPNKPFKYASRNPRTHYKRLRSGEIFLLEVEVDEEVWNQVRTLPENALLENISWHHDGDNSEPEPILGTMDSPKKKAPRGPYSEFWRVLVINGVKNHPDLQEVLDCTPEHVWNGLHAAFETETMSTVSPRVWEAWVKEKGLSESLITMSRNAEIKAAEKAGMVS